MTIILDITGMTCGHCVKHTQEALQAVEGVEQATVTLEPGRAVVEGNVDTAALLQAVADAGYSAVVGQ